jgi:hypothetical protein
MKNDILPVLKMRYNRAIKKSMTIKEYFKGRSVEQCLKYTKIFNQNLQELNNIEIQIQMITGKEITDHERINGFELGGEY